jgi:hypothetical protein
VPPIFHPSTNTFARLSLAGAGALSFGAIALAITVYHSPLETGVGREVPQPVPFSHKLHGTGIGIECRYCHGTAETSTFAGMPSNDVCMNCHVQIQAQSPLLAPVREGFANGQPVAWNRVYDLPDFVYFDHSVHVLNGFACETCHGRVDQMEALVKTEPLTMLWCLECHRHPERFVRPREAVYAVGWQPEDLSASQGTVLAQAYDLQRLTDCSVCHR